MTDGYKNILFTLMRAGLHIGDRHTADFSICDQSSWRDIYALAKKQGVAAIVWDGLQRLMTENKIPADSMPDRTLRIEWAYNVERINGKYAKQREAIGKLCGIYGRHGVRMMVLKGYGLSLNYPVPEHRPCGDIDIWLFGEQERADRILGKELGIEIKRDVHHHTVFHLDSIMVENHFDFLNIHSHTSNRSIEKHLKNLALQQGGTTVVDGNTVYLPSPDFNALFLLRHAAAHFAAVNIALRHIVDWAMFVQRYHKEIDWMQFENIAREQNMHRFLHCLNAIVVDYFDIPKECLPPIERDAELELRVVNDILHPEFDEESPHGNIIKSLIFKFRRWWANRWKHRIVYREGLIHTFLIQTYSHLLKPKSLK